jgi:hypothetical protein
MRRIRHRLACAAPQRHRERVDVELLPQCSLIARAMQLATMNPPDRNSELVARAASQCARLCEGEVMRIRRHAAANKAGLPQNELPVVLIAQPNRFAQSTDRVTAKLLFGSR